MSVIMLFKSILQADKRLQKCIENQIASITDSFYLKCLEKAYALYPEGYEDLVLFLGKWFVVYYITDC